MAVILALLLDYSRKARWALVYVAIIVLVNVMFGKGWPNLATFTVGAGFLARDLAQRDIRHNVLWATALGVVLSFMLAPAGVAAASAAAFALSETADWLVVWRMERRPLWQRMVVSHLVAVPLDSAVFLYGLTFNGAKWSWIGFAVMTGVKLFALSLVTANIIGEHTGKRSHLSWY
jgi:queuosine precursor transporter